MKNGSANGDSTGAHGCFPEISDRPRYHWINVTQPGKIVEYLRFSTGRAQRSAVAPYSTGRVRYRDVPVPRSELILAEFSRLDISPTIATDARERRPSGDVKKSHGWLYFDNE